MNLSRLHVCPAMFFAGCGIERFPGRAPALFEQGRIGFPGQGQAQIDNGPAVGSAEGFPGHLYQTVYSRTHAKTPLSALLSCSGANEGWATYVENIACTFDNGLSRAAGKYRAHMRSLSLCVHGLLDIGINYDGWDEARAGEFIRSCFQADDQTVRELWQVMIDNPANYLEYCGGYIEYMDMREQAEAALGSRFSPLDFHKLLLDLGPVPFSVIRPRFTAWLEEQV